MPFTVGMVPSKSSRLIRKVNNLLKKDGNFIEHGGIGLVSYHLRHVFQFIDLTDHLFKPLIVIDQKPDAALIANPESVNREYPQR